MSAPSGDFAVAARLQAVGGPQAALVVLMGPRIGLGARLGEGLVGARKEGGQEASAEARLPGCGSLLSLCVEHVRFSETGRGR